MKIEQLKFIEQKRLSEFGLSDFFKKTLDYLRDELQRLRTTIYDYNQHEYIFALNERAWVGALNNAIIRAYPDSSVTLQEIGVYNKSSFVGRADFLVYWKGNDGKPLYLLFEAKQYEEVSKAEMLDDTADFMNIIRTQGQKYFEAEIEYYKDKKVFIIPIAFGWIRKHGYITEAKKYFEQSDKKDNSTDFCSLYFEGDYGVWAYGKVFDARK